MNRGRKPPAPDDHGLWETVVRTVAPLHPLRPPPKAEAAPVAPRKKPAAQAAPPQPAPVRTPPPTPPALAPLDRRTRARVSRGVTAIDARIDLHGLTQAVAHRRLLAFLSRAQDDYARLVLVITGKGRASDAPAGGDDRGVLRRMVPVWLAAPELRPLVVGFEPAGRSHGGEGALYVRVRRRKPG
jgi:DNA-nicking Smr family endonuclease